jgi:hypothetical protein
MLKYVLNVIIYLALAVWIGSLVFFGAGVASVLFQPELNLGRTLAGAINTMILRRLGMIELAAGVLLVGGTFYTAFRYKHVLNWVVLVISVAMLGTAFYYTNVLYPKMETVRVAIGDFDNVPVEKMELKAEFDQGHKRYSTLVKGVLAGGILVLILHTVAFVRYTEMHEDRYRELHSRWRAHLEKAPEPEEEVTEAMGSE